MRKLQPVLWTLVLIVFAGCYHQSALSPNISYDEGTQGEQYNEILENPFTSTADQPISTFSVDADGGAFSNVRRILNEGRKPESDAIRIEEFINYFPFDYPNPNTGEAIALNGEVSACPWNTAHKLVRIGIKGKSFEVNPHSNFVLLVDVSGSMENEMPLVREALTLLAESFEADDRIAIVTYSGKVKVALESTPGDDQNKILKAIDKLKAGGSTAGGAAIEMAYDIAVENLIEEGNNRVIMITDGDFNVGISSQEDLIALIESRRDQGVFLTTVGTGSGNYQEGKMEQLANNGNGTFEYLDNIEQAEKIFVHERSKLFTVAKDVKVQVEFNPNLVESYRLIGYENRLLENSDFQNDSTDAGEIGAGQTVTALYEIVPATGSSNVNDPSFTIDFRYKFPDEDVSRPLSLEIVDEGNVFAQASENMRWAAAISALGLLMRDSQYKGDANWAEVREWMQDARSFDPHGFRNGGIEFLDLARPFYE